MTTLEINKELNGIEVIFDSKPAQAMIENLKSNGFRWHRVKKLWYAKNTAERLALAESIADGKTTEPKKTVKKATSIPSLWDRCKTVDIPEHDRRTDTKTVAAETRKHIKERFPEIKFSCRIGSGGWAACNEVNFSFKSAPFAKDSIYFEAVKNYVKAWLWSFNYDNSDSMTDYFDRNFYENISTWDFEETEPTESQKTDLANFDAESQKAKEEEEKRREEEFQKYLAEQEEKEKAYKEYQKIVEAQKEEINAHVKVVEIPESEKYIVSGTMLCGMGKECNIDELKKWGEEKEESALVKRELHFTNEGVYNNFCNLFLHDFDFLSKFGGTGTLDARVTSENYSKLNSVQRESVKWILWDCVAVFLNGDLKLIIDPEGYGYARYVNIACGECEKTMLNEEEDQESKKERENFYIPAPIEEQAEGVEDLGEYTLIYIDPWTTHSTMHHITISKKDIRRYAQYENSLYLEYTESEKRKAQYQYFHDGSNVLLYKGFLPSVPAELIKKKIDDSMYQIRNAGINVDDFMVDVYKYYKNNGYIPVINTLQF